MYNTKIHSIVIRLFFFLFFCLIWQGAAYYLVAIPGPFEIFFDIVFLLGHGIIFNILISIWRVFVALVVSLTFGLFLGLLSAQVPLLGLFLSTTLTPIIEALPPLAWTIICIFILGIGETSVLFIVCVILIQFFIVSTIESLKNIDKNLVEMAQSFPLGQWLTLDKISIATRVNILRYVESGMIIPYILIATRLAYGVAWKVIVVAEMFGASEGVGYLINQAYSTLSIKRLISLSTLIVLLFVLGDCVVLQNINKRFKKWQV